MPLPQVNISGVGELSLWEFSGHEAYFPVYDHFIGNTSCVHLVVFSLNQPFDVQLQQCSFWLSFLQARIPPMEPLSECLSCWGYLRGIMVHGDIFV